MAASAANEQMTPTTPTTRPTLNKPCSKGRNTCVIDKRESHSRRPGWPATVKSKTHEPMVKASVMMAAVAALSDMDAANSAMAPISRP